MGKSWDEVVRGVLSRSLVWSVLIVSATCADVAAQEQGWRMAY
jgi:hypothetical protein